jgi:hypothetical protein
MDRTRDWLAPAFLFYGSPHPFPSRAYLIDPTGELVGERSDNKQRGYHDEQK